MYDHMDEQVFDFLKEVSAGVDDSPPIVDLGIEGLNKIVVLDEDDLEGWDFRSENCPIDSELLKTAKKIAKSRKRKLVKLHVLSMDAPSEYDIELYALEFGMSYGTASAMVQRKREGKKI